MLRIYRITCVTAIVVIAVADRAPAQTGGPFDLSWNSIDGGGATISTGGQFSLGGTIGQCDSSLPLTGGDFQWVGGFWAGAVPAGTGAPAVSVLSASLRKTHAIVGADEIALNTDGRVENSDVTSESRAGGITELRVAFDVAPGGPGSDPVTLEEQACAACPCVGSQAGWASYSGSAAVGASIEGTSLVLTFSPGLENGRTYKLIFGTEVTSLADQSIEVRALLGDVNSDGRVNATDRSIVVGVWTSASHYSAETDIDLSGRTKATDRSLVVAAWTGAERCAP